MSIGQALLSALRKESQSSKKVDSNSNHKVGCRASKRLIAIRGPGGGLPEDTVASRL